MSEVVYRYKRGRGWTVGPAHRTETHKIGNYMVTFEERHPEPGEHGFAYSDFSIDTDYIVTAAFYIDTFMQDDAHIRIALPKYYEGDTWVKPLTITWKEI